MGKTRHYRPEERSIHRAKPTTDKSGKYKHIYNVDDEDDDVDESWGEEYLPSDDD